MATGRINVRVKHYVVGTGVAVLAFAGLSIGTPAAAIACASPRSAVAKQLRAEDAVPVSSSTRASDVACRGRWAFIRQGYVARKKHGWHFYDGVPTQRNKQDALPNWLWKKVGSPPVVIRCWDDRLEVRPTTCDLQSGPDIATYHAIQWTSWGRRNAKGTAVGVGPGRFTIRLFRPKDGMFTRIEHHGFVEIIDTI